MQDQQKYGVNKEIDEIYKSLLVVFPFEKFHKDDHDLQLRNNRLQKESKKKSKSNTNMRIAKTEEKGIPHSKGFLFIIISLFFPYSSLSFCFLLFISLPCICHIKAVSQMDPTMLIVGPQLGSRSAYL